MKKIFLIIIQLVLVIGVIVFKFVLTGEKYLVVGINPGIPPFQYIDTKNDGDVVGLDIYLINEVAEKQGKTLKTQTMTFR